MDWCKVGYGRLIDKKKKKRGWATFHFKASVEQEDQRVPLPLSSNKWWSWKSTSATLLHLQIKCVHRGKWPKRFKGQSFSIRDSTAIDPMNSKSLGAPQHISERPVQKLSASIKRDGAWNEIPEGAVETGGTYFFSSSPSLPPIRRATFPRPLPCTVTFESSNLSGCDTDKRTLNWKFDK